LFKTFLDLGPQKLLLFGCCLEPVLAVAHFDSLEEAMEILPGGNRVHRLNCRDDGLLCEMSCDNVFFLCCVTANTHP